jgi:hypothetical protein
MIPMPLIPLLMLVTANCIRGGLSNTTSLTGLMQNESSAIASCVPGAPSYMMGWAILLILTFVAFGVMAMRFDVGVAGAVAGYLSIGFCLMLQQLGLLGQNAIGIPFVITVCVTIVLLLRGGLRPYG